MSSVYPDYMEFTFEADKAVDGIYQAKDLHDYSSTASTAGTENSPWWRVNLQTNYCIWAVNILNRPFMSEAIKHLYLIFF